MIEFGRLPVDSLDKKSKIEKELEEFRKIEHQLFEKKGKDKKKAEAVIRRPTEKLEKSISIAMTKKESKKSFRSEQLSDESLDYSKTGKLSNKF